MATLVLTAVGTAVGGPIGGALGALVGQQLDGALFGPRARHGPRLGDLSVQTSSYGTAIPKLFGTMRVAGTVIWATDLIESRSESGGKGQPKTVAYSYSASLAVALSARPIVAVGRIWADGKLLRGSAGDFKSAAIFRLHRGDEDQEVDPLIAAAEGIGQAPAYRGLAYAVFENLRLEDFGNRIPSLTFEVVADPAPVAIGTIAGELSEARIVAGATAAVLGYAAGGDSVRSAVEALADVVPLSLADRDGALRLAAEVGAPKAIARAEESRRREIVRRAAAGVPDEVSIAYYDADRDFQAGLQRAAVGAGGNARNADRRALPAALRAEAAKALAEFRLSALRAGRLRARLGLGWARSALRPGDAVLIEGEAGPWKVERCTLGAMSLELELVRVTGAALPAPVAAHSGRPVSELDRVHGATLLRLLDLPLGEAREGRPLLLAAAAGVSAGWRRAHLLASFDGGAEWKEAGATAAPATLGTAETALPAADALLFDAVSTVDVELANEAMWLEQASDDAMVGGANLALVGDELVQFGRAQWLGGRRFRLSRLLRGRRGTEWAAAGHAPGEPFLLVEGDALTAIEAPAGSIGGEAQVSAAGIGDGDEPALAAKAISGESIRPPSPVHLGARRLGNGDVAIGWVRRSRQGWAWASGGDTPLGEEREAYRVEIAGDGFGRTVDTDRPGHVYTAADQAADGAGGTLQISVRQLGTHAVSRPATLVLP